MENGSSSKKRKRSFSKDDSVKEEDKTLCTEANRVTVASAFSPVPRAPAFAVPADSVVLYDDSPLSQLSQYASAQLGPASVDAVPHVLGIAPAVQHLSQVHGRLLHPVLSPQQIAQLQIQQQQQLLMRQAQQQVDPNFVQMPADPNRKLTPYEMLASNHHYLLLLQHTEARLKAVRAKLVKNELTGLEAELASMRAELDRYRTELDELKSTVFLRPGEFSNLLSLEEFINKTLMPQLGLYDLDLQHLQNPDTYAICFQSNRDRSGDLAVCLSVVNQESSGPISKEKAIGPFTLRLLTGATISQIQSGPVQPEIIDSTQRIKKGNQELENTRQSFKENGTVCFSELKFSSGTFPTLVKLKFRVTIQLVVNGRSVAQSIESIPTKPFISMTNTGSQWKDAAGAWLKEECFGDLQEITIARLWNYFQRHYILSTKQELNCIKRPLHQRDFEYLLNAKFKQGSAEKATLTQKEFQTFWEWIGPGLKKIRYQKYLLWMFENGYLAAFVTNHEATEQLKTQKSGTFIIRLSERINGELVISYTYQSSVRHYLIQPDDTADKKKTLIDFLGQNPLFTHLLQLTTMPNGTLVWTAHEKNAIFQKFYKKSSKPETKQSGDGNPYDTRLPLYSENTKT